MKVEFSYCLGNEPSPKFSKIEPFQVINHVSKHTLDYKVDKTEENNKFFAKIEVSSYNNNQIISIESTDSIFNMSLIVIIVLAPILLMTFIAVYFNFRVLYGTKRDQSENVIIEKVSPEDYN